jgi:hypothetical protein
MRAASRNNDAGVDTRRRDPAGHVRLSVAERRQYRRGAVTLSATLKINDESFSAELVDISVGGAQLCCSVVPGAGMLISIELEGFGAVPARVIRRLPRAIAVEFDLPETHRAEIAEKLDRLLKAHA